MTSPSLEQLSMSVGDVVTLFFENLKVEFNWRQTNEVAHTLAREITFLTSPMFLMTYHVFGH